MPWCHLLFFSLLALFTLIWLFVILHLSWPKRVVTAPAAPALPELLKPTRYCSNEPKPFEGLTQKPHCALCERDTAFPKAPPPVPPAPMAPTHRRPREVDTSKHFCPYHACAYRGWLGLGNLRANGHPSGGPWRQFHCTSCNGYFLETHGTLFHGKQAAVELIVRVLACLVRIPNAFSTKPLLPHLAKTLVLPWCAILELHLRAIRGEIS